MFQIIYVNSDSLVQINYPETPFVVPRPSGNLGEPTIAVCYTLIYNVQGI
jgi:hypothetical protein